MNKKNKIFVKVFAAVMAGMMLVGGCASLLYMIFVKKKIGGTNAKGFRRNAINKRRRLNCIL